MTTPAQEAAGAHDANSEADVTGYTAHVRRGDTNWLIHVPTVDRTTQARTLHEVEPMARDLIAVMTDLDPSAIEVKVTPDTPRSQHDPLVAANTAPGQTVPRQSLGPATPGRTGAEPVARQGRPVDPDRYAVTVDGAQTMLFDRPEPCPVLPGLVLDGVAVDPTGHHHLALTLHRDDRVVVRVHLGPDEAMIARRGLIIVAALRSHGDLDGPEHSIAILAWLASCWTTFHEELTR